jgi:hypothetical protein
MDDKMREVADDMVRHDSQRLVAHGRFLAERFGTSSLDLDSMRQTGSASVPPVATRPIETARPSATAKEAEERERVR